MTARKKTSGSKKRTATKKRTTAKKKTRSALARIEDELPANLRDYAKQVHKQLNSLERDIERAIPQARRRTARLIREASHKLGSLEASGQKAWRARADSMTRDAQKLLRKLEKAVAPTKKSAGKKKKKSAAKKSGQKKSVAVEKKRSVATPTAAPAALPHVSPVSSPVASPPVNTALGGD
jgi:hypothetical protein